MGEDDEGDEVEPGGPEDLDYLVGERTSSPTAAERCEEAEGLTRPLGEPDEAAHRHAHRTAAAPVAGGTVHVPVQPGPQDREHLPESAAGAAQARDAGIPPPHGARRPPPQGRG
jgi:hypothetical protein